MGIELVQQDLARALLGREITAKPIVVRHFQVAECGEFPSIPEGTIALFAAHGADELAPIIEALDNGDLPRLGELLDQNREMFRDTLASETKMFQSLDDVPAFGDFQYGRTTILNAMFVPPKVRFASSRVLYSGAPIDAGSFRLIQRTRSDTEVELYGLAVIREVRLTDLERKVLDRISREEAELTFNPGGTVYFTPAAALAAAWVGKAALAGAVGWAVGKALDAAWDWAFGNLMDPGSRQRYVSAIGDHRIIGRLDPHLAVAELLRLRSESLRAPTERWVRSSEE